MDGEVTKLLEGNVGIANMNFLGGRFFPRRNLLAFS